MESLHSAIAQCQKAYPHIRLIALLPLSLQIHGQLRRTMALILLVWVSASIFISLEAKDSLLSRRRFIQSFLRILLKNGEYPYCIRKAQDE